MSRLLSVARGRPISLLHRVGRPRLGNRDRELPHTQNVGGALGDADAATGIEHIEGVGALQGVIKRRQHQARLEQRGREVVVLTEELAVELGKATRRERGHLTECVLGLLNLVLQTNLAVRDALGPLQVIDVIDAL